MTQETPAADDRYEEIAREGYTIWRGSFPGEANAPPHWDDLTDRERRGIVAVSAYAIGRTWYDWSGDHHCRPNGEQPAGRDK